jgi:hypothetical protein
MVDSRVLKRWAAGLMLKEGSLMRKIVCLAILAGFALNSWASARSAIGAGDLLDALPDGNGVVLIDSQKIVGSSLWTALSAQEKFKSSIDKAQSEISDLGLKWSDVQAIALVFPASGMNNPVIAVSGGFEQSDLLARLRASGRVKLTSEKYKEFEVYKTESIAAEVQVAGSEKPANTAKAQSQNTISPGVVRKNQTSFVFHDPKTIVIGAPEAVRASVDVKMGALPGIAKNVKLADAIAQNPTAAVRFALTVTPGMTAGLDSSQLPIPDFSSVKLIFGAIDATSGLDLNATLRTNTAEQAKSLSERLNGLLGMAKGYLGSMNDPKTLKIVEALKTISISNAEVDVKIVGSVPFELLNSLLFSSATKGQ